MPNVVACVAVDSFFGDELANLAGKRSRRKQKSTIFVFRKSI
jgi:hypothetical protein